MQNLFVATGGDFMNPAVYSGYRNDPAYRDFYWEVKGDNLKPDNPTPQELAIYNERERQRLLNSAKSLATGAIPAIMAGVAGKIAASTSKPGATTGAATPATPATPASTKSMTVGDEPYSPNGLSDGGMAHPVAGVKGVLQQGENTFGRLGDATTSPWLNDHRAGVRVAVEEFREGGSYLVPRSTYENWVAGKDVVGR